MPEPIDFFFDFSSPYGYLAAARIEEVLGGRGREIVWRPYMLGAAMKLSGSRPLVQVPLMRDYVAHDFARSARRYRIPFQLPEPFPIAALAPTRAFYWLHDRDPGSAKAFAQAAFAAYFAAGRNVAEPEVVREIVHDLGLDAEAVVGAIASGAVKQRVKEETDRAIKRGVFGSPFVIVDGEPFWGNDRLEQASKWLETGGW